MALRIADDIVRGELDCTRRGRVSGWVELSTRPDRVFLDLRGHCRADLAGFRFRLDRIGFPAQQPSPNGTEGLAARQTGSVGVFTQMTKRRELDSGVEDLVRRSRLGEPPPAPWRRAVHLEWFSDQNGRVVIEDTRLQLVEVGERSFFYAKQDLRALSSRSMPGSPGTSSIREWSEPELGLGFAAMGDATELEELGSLIDHSPEHRSRPDEDQLLVSDLFQPPIDLPPIATIDSALIPDRVDRLTRQLASAYVSLSMCEHFSIAEAYEWIRTHVLTATILRPGTNSRRPPDPVALSTAASCIECEIMGDV